MANITPQKVFLQHLYFYSEGSITGKTIHKCGTVYMTDVNRIYSVCDTHPKFAWIFKRRSLGYALRLHSHDSHYKYM